MRDREARRRAGMPITASWCRSVAGPGEVRDSIRPIAQRWRDRTSRAETARWRIAVRQSTPLGGQVDLAEDEVDHAVEEVALVGDVVVERHRLDAEDLAELAHAQRRDPRLVGERDSGAQHSIARQRCSPRQRAS